MQQAAQAYGRVAKQTASPRQLEATLLLRAASRLQAIREATALASEIPELSDEERLAAQQIFVGLKTRCSELVRSAFHLRAIASPK